MQSTSQAPKPRRFDASRRTAASAGSKFHGSGFQREDKNMNTIASTLPRRLTKPAASAAAPCRSRAGVQPRAPALQSRLSSQKQGSAPSRSAKPKPKSARASKAAPTAALAPAPPAPLPLPLPSALPLDPNCNEPSLPCLCCDGRSPQDNNSMFNHNHNNNNTVSLRQQMRLPPPPAPLPQRQDGTAAEEERPSPAPPADPENGAEKADESADADNKKKAAEEDDDDEESSGDVAIEDAEETDSDEDEDDDDDDTLVPSCCDCPRSLLEFSLSSSTSSSSTSISSCSDLESDGTDQSVSFPHDQVNLSVAPDPKDPKVQLSARPPPSLPVHQNPFSLTSRSPNVLCSPDEGYPSALDSPSPDFPGLKGDSEANKLDLLDFLESVGEFGKMERFSQVIQVARWDLEGEQHWDVLRDRLDHLDRLEKVNREVKLAYIARLHEKGFDLGDLEEQGLTGVLDEMGNIDIPWKLYKSYGGTMGGSQEFSDAGVDLTAPSDTDEPPALDSLTPSPEEPPPRPPKPPVRHASVTSDLHTYINISRETSSASVTSSPTLTTFSPNSLSPTFTTFRCEKPLPLSPPSIPPLPASKPVPYLALYSTPSPPPTVPTPTPPVPPPRKRHLARKEAQRLAALQAKQERTPVSLPPPTTRPPPLPPPPVISVTSSSASSSSSPSSPPALPPPPSFHALDVEIRKLLMLAGLTQAELLKLSPELGVCVGGLEDEEEEEEGDSGVTPMSPEPREFRLQGEPDGGKLDEDGRSDPCGSGSKKEESKNPQRTTSFSEMARRRRRNPGLMANHYYGSSFGKAHEAMSVGTFRYPNDVPTSPPPPPPPRPLPPIPPSAPSLKVSTLPANSERPERFDWLIAFTPECDAPPQTEGKRRAEPSGRPASSASPPPRPGPRVTTFKELRSRNKSASPPTMVIGEPEPDPAVVTPDPDILYNLKWRRETAGSGGSQWEYTSQAQALFMQPPPALTSMAALQEMLRRADREGGRPELCPSQRIGCDGPAAGGDGGLWAVGKERERGGARQEKQEVMEQEEEEEVRGQADGGRTLESGTTAVRGVPSASAGQRAGDAPWMGEDEEPPVRGLGLTSRCQQEKKALVSAVSVAVEAILAQFSSSRTAVQKALSGDSAVNPSLGRLVLQRLCPALHSLLTDGLKPHQSDLIAGRRPNSAWGLVQATTRPGPKTQALFNLQVRVCELPQLRQSRQRFNAFLLGLLNTKLLDFWLSHLQSCSDVLDAHYHPGSFVRLSLTACRPLFEELLLVLQPLSLLTFNLDLLFQHHHLEPDAQGPETGGPPQPAARGDTKIHGGTEILSGGEFGEAKSSPGVDPNSEGSAGSTDTDAEPTKASFGFGQTSPQLLWVQEKEIGALPPPDVEEDGFAQHAGQVIQQGWGAVVRWGGRLSQNLAELSLSAARKEEEDEARAGSDYVPVSAGGAPVPWSLGRLFGASKDPNGPTGHTVPTRRPSQWLAPGVTALTRMVSSTSAPALRRVPEPQGGRESESRNEDADAAETKDKPKPLRSVRTLCDHSGTGSELSFCKGEELVVLGGVDHDWIRCRQGDKEGLVPIGYTSLIM